MGRYKCKLSYLSLCFKCAIWALFFYQGKPQDQLQCRILSQPMVVLQILSYVSWINPLPIQVWPKNRASRAHIVGPGVEMRDDPVERRRRNNSLDRDRRSATSLE